jgi:hypothetical protein
MPRSEWALVYWDSRAVLLIRRAKVSAEWLKTREYRLLRPHDTRFLGLLIASGAVPIADVQAEITRYERDIDDPLELLRLKYWIGEFREGLDRSARGPGALNARVPAPSARATPPRPGR